MAKKTLREPEKSSKKEATFKITNELGLHARAAALFVKVASAYRSEIIIRKGNQSVNGKSIMGVLMLAAARGSEIRVIAQGDDAAQALQELGRLIERKFGEA